MKTIALLSALVIAVSPAFAGDTKPPPAKKTEPAKKKPEAKKPDSKKPMPSRTRADMIRAAALKWQSRDKLRDLPAEQNVGRDIRRALEKFPAEIRPQVEKLLLESGRVPKGAIPLKEVPVPQAPPVGA